MVPGGLGEGTRRDLLGICQDMGRNRSIGRWGTHMVTGGYQIGANIIVKFCIEDKGAIMGGGIHLKEYSSEEIPYHLEINQEWAPVVIGRWAQLLVQGNHVHIFKEVGELLQGLKLQLLKQEFLEGNREICGEMMG